MSLVGDKKKSDWEKDPLYMIDRLKKEDPNTWKNIPAPVASTIKWIIQALQAVKTKMKSEDYERKTLNNMTMNRFANSDRASIDLEKRLIGKIDDKFKQVIHNGDELSR